MIAWRSCSTSCRTTIDVQANEVATNLAVAAERPQGEDTRAKEVLDIVNRVSDVVSPIHERRDR